MNTYFNSIHVPSFLYSGSLSEIATEFRGRINSNLQVLAVWIRYNDATLAGSIVGINWGLLYLSEKTISFVSPLFKGDFFNKPWLRHSSSWLFRIISVGAGIHAINHAMDLQVTPPLLAASVVTTIALKLFWQKVLTPGISHFWSGKPKVGAAANEVEEIEKEEDPDLKEEESVSSTHSSPRDLAGSQQGNRPSLNTTVLDDAILDDHPPTRPPSARLESEELVKETELHETCSAVESGGTESMLQTGRLDPTLAYLRQFDD